MIVRDTPLQAPPPRPSERAAPQAAPGASALALAGNPPRSRPTGPIDAAAVQADALKARAPVEASTDVEKAVERAAKSLFAGRDLDIRSFHDERSGRYVVRIADKRSGEVLAQTPPDALLRFYQSARTDDGPLVTIRA